MALYANLLETMALVTLFRRYPPLGFTVSDDTKGLPVFTTRFDLLTTLEDDVRQKIIRLPGFSFWGKRLLQVNSCFIGATVTEYVPLPRNQIPLSLLEHIKTAYVDSSTLTIIKDLPDASPFLSPEENEFSQQLIDQALEMGFLAVEGQALAFVPIDFADIDEYLSRLSYNRRRDMRRKLKKRALIRCEKLDLGDPAFSDAGFLQLLYQLYLEVFHQSTIHFDLLSEEFFTALLQDAGQSGKVFLYRHGEKLAGFNLCLIRNNMLIDKYIGLSYPLAHELNLYFVSWFENLAYARAQGLTTYIAGWTDPEVKASLGAQFTFTRHLVWVRPALLRSVLVRLRHYFSPDRKRLEEV